MTRPNLLLIGLTGALLAWGCGDDTTASDLSGAHDLSANADMAASTPSCSAYCTTIQANCTGAIGANMMYPNMQSCLHACALFSVGTSADTSGDTLGCRLYHANAAKGDPATHCPHAGPSGGGVCGTDRCAAFCELASAVCTSANGLPGTFPFTSKSQCMSVCGTAPFKFDTTMPEQQEAGATLNCAFYHLTEAFVDPNPDAGATASDHCEDFDPNNAGRGCQ